MSLRTTRIVAVVVLAMSLTAVIYFGVTLAIGGDTTWPSLVSPAFTTIAMVLLLVSTNKTARSKDHSDAPSNTQ